MLKHIANNITKSFDLEQINRTGRAPKLQIYVAHALIFPVVVILFEKVSQGVIFVFSGQTKISSGFFAFPFAKSSGFKIVHFSRPIPRHLHQLGESFQKIVFGIFSIFTIDDPKDWLLNFISFQPFFALICPVIQVFISVIKEKLKKFSIRNKHFACLELFCNNLPVSKLTVPSVIIGFFNWFVI